MTMLPAMQKDNAEEKARRVRLLRIWTDICAMALCEMPEGRSENMVHLNMDSVSGHTWFRVFVAAEGKYKHVSSVCSDSHNAEDRLIEIQRRLKPYVA